MIGLINASPKIHKSSSQAIINDFKLFISEEEIIEFNIKRYITVLEIEKILECDKLIFVFPLYVDGIPSHLLKALVEIENYIKASDTKKPTVYGIVNCGFYEGDQTKLALKNLELWCNKTGLNWGQGLGIGAGGMLEQITTVPVGKGPKKSEQKAFENLSKSVLDGIGGENIFITANLPKFVYKLAAESNWKTKAKENGLNKKEIKRKT